ncbi:resuscitation-promoting factor [Tessaracoccus flavus]|uniref:Uncharacterized protein n=1 Tax=Tessaracoccus flavus TaxID=1610493 RepID=A0A1Q2CDJ0_9ACTN|nr:resuscitation-promoting factor [Tessaracoccus flavus]AQP44179.1 hypothetical protein RPIT_04580 [Tessaracoccus flavus]SDY37435.1 Uncharacterized conserved protein YabE, contains G5 and tandem DUF348 domains [Tessaracoccus flavus]
MARSYLIPVLAGVSALALVGGATAVSALEKNDVTLVVDGTAKTVALREDTVAEVLELEGIELGSHDVVLPAADSEIVDGIEISVAYGRPLDVTVDGESRRVWTTARSVGEALRMLDLDASTSLVSASRSQSIGRAGLEVDIQTAKDVQLIAAGSTTSITLAGTVQDVLDKAGVAPDADDKVSPAPTTALADGMTIQVVAVEVKQSTKTVELPYEKTSVKTDKLYTGEQKVTTKGVVGVKTETYTDIYEDGVLVSSELAGSEVTKQPVAQVTSIGTKAKPKPKPAPAPAPQKTESKSSSSSSTPAASTSSSGLNLAREAMWVRIAECESNNRWNINTGNGYYGGLQFNLPTWRSVGGTDFAPYPHQASRAEQITVANRLYAQRGTQPWSCA